MSMVYCLRRASDASLAALLERPDHIFAFVEAENTSVVSEAPGLLARLFGGKLDPVPDFARSDGDEADLDKAWHAIHFVLTGSPDATRRPLSLIVEDWPSIGTKDEHALGKGPAHAVGARAMARFHEELSRVNDDQLRLRYDVEDMAAHDVYHADELLQDIDHGWRYVRDHIDTLRGFAAGAAAAGSGAVVWFG